MTTTFGPQAVAGCYEISDLVPSGLAPIDHVMTRYSEDAPASSFLSPYRIDGQRVSFCVSPTAKSRTVKVRYFARIVTAGTYAWEAAVIQSGMAPESINLTNRRTVTIR